MPPTTAGPLTDRHILVVEDEYFLADDLAGALRALGAEVIGPVAEADQALQLVDGTVRIDAAVLDINLRGAMVYDVATAIRRRGIPFVFATGYDQAVIPPELWNVPRWEKPFDVAALARALPDLVGSQRRLASSQSA